MPLGSCNSNNSETLEVLEPVDERKSEVVLNCEQENQNHIVTKTNITGETLL